MCEKYIKKGILKHCLLKLDSKKKNIKMDHAQWYETKLPGAAFTFTENNQILEIWLKIEWHMTSFLQIINYTYV